MQYKAGLFKFILDEIGCIALVLFWNATNKYDIGYTPAPCSCSVHSVSPLKVTKSLSSYNSALCICQWFIQQEGIALDVLSTVIRFVALEGGSVPVALSSAFISQGSLSAFQYTILIMTFDAQPKKAFDISPIRSVFHFSTNKNTINQQVLGILWVARM